VTIKN